MTPEQFIAKLSVQFTTRHDTEGQATEWFGQVSEALQGYSSDVLEKVARDFIHERKARSFPLVGEIREMANRHIQNRPTDDVAAYRVHRQRVEYASQIEQYRLAAEWRDKVTASHGSVDNWLTATVHRRRDGALGKGARPGRRSSFRPVSASLSETTKRMTGDAE